MRHAAVFAILAMVATLPSAVSAGPQECCYFDLDPRDEPVTPTPYPMAEADVLIVQDGVLTYEPLTGNYRMAVLPWTWLALGGTTYSPACSDRDYHGQPSAANRGGGVLVGPDLVLTAAHLMRKFGDSGPVGCWRQGFVFGYGNLSEPWEMTCVQSQCWVTVPGNDVYECEQIVHYSYGGNDDWALVRLNANVTGRTPLPIRTTAGIPVTTPITVVGHPNRIPMKVESVEVTSTSTYGYDIDAHVLGGSSGSMAVDTANGQVVGVIKSGGTIPKLACDPPIGPPCYRECFNFAGATIEPAYKAAPWIP